MVATTETMSLDPCDSSTWPEWLTPEECAQVLRLSMSTIRFLTQSAKIKSRKFGRRVRVRKSDLLSFVESR
jgi:excisionase family DNA binding protein